MEKNKFEQTSENTEWFEWSKSLLDLYETEKQVLIKDALHRLSFLSLRKWIIARQFTGVERLLKILLLDALMSADGKVPGSGLFIPWFLYNQNIETYTQRLSSEEYLLATISKTKNEKVKEIFRAIYSVVGPLTKIVVKNSVESDVIIKYRNSFQFPLFLDSQFHRIIGHAEFIEQTNPIIVMIEGSPETVGEINNLLQWNHEKGRPVILIARSFPEEVSATLATNWVKGSLSIMPLVYGDSLETINLAADMCTITKGELISAHFGDVIASSILDEDKWGTVERIEWTSKGLSIFKDVNIARHVNKLIEKIKKAESEDLISILRDRMLSLSNDAIEVWVPKENIQAIEELDSLIKIYNGFVVSGAVETQLGLLPKCFVDAAQDSAESLRKEILNIGGFLVRVDDEVVA